MPSASNFFIRKDGKVTKSLGITKEKALLLALFLHRRRH